MFATDLCVHTSPTGLLLSHQIGCSVLNYICHTVLAYWAACNQKRECGTEELSMFKTPIQVENDLATVGYFVSLSHDKQATSVITERIPGLGQTIEKGILQN